MINSKPLTHLELVEKIQQLEASIIHVNPYMTTKEVLAYTKLSKFTLDSLCHKKKIHYTKPNGKNRYFKRSDIDKFLMNNQIH